MEAGHEQALLQLAIIRCTQKDYLESENLLRRAIHGQSKNAEVFLQLALVLLLANHNVVEAEKLLRQAVQLDPHNSKAHFNLGRVLEQIGMHKEAEVSHLVARTGLSGLTETGNAGQERYWETLALDPQNSSAYFNLGFLLQFEKGDTEGAEEAYRRALEFEPTHSGALNNLGHLLYSHHNDCIGAEVSL